MSLATNADYLDERAHALAELRAARKANRVANVDWFEAFYKAYVGVILIATLLYFGAGWLGDEPLSESQFKDAIERGPHYLGLLVALALAIGLRSAGRGGPLAFERADISQVLLAPVDRFDSVRSTAVRGLRHAVFIGGAAGAAIGLIASRRLPDSFEWVLSGAVFGGATAMCGHGAALAVSGWRWRAAWCDVAALFALLWATGEAFWQRPVSPFGFIGYLATWPGDENLLALAGIAIALICGYTGLRFVTGLSLESAERRSGLVGQLRFAATTQDVRTVMLIQRQLSQQQLRHRPWVRIRARTERPTRQGAQVARLSVFTRRSLQGFMRWPLLRIVRLLVLVAVADLALVGVWAGTTSLSVVAGLALWIAALDLLEPLAQESDRPDRADGAPAIVGLVHLRLLAMPTMIMLLLVGLGALPLLLLGPSDVMFALAPYLISVVGSAVGGAALVVTRRPSAGGEADLIPEVAGIKLLWQLVLPPGLAIFGMLPFALARHEWFDTGSAQEVAAASNLAGTAGLAFATWCFLWIRYGDAIREALVTVAKTPPTSDTSADKGAK